MADAHDRILEFTMLMDESDDSVAVSAVKFYRDRSKLEDTDGFTVPFSGGGAAVSPVEVETGSVMPPPTHFRFVFTFQA